MDVLPAPRLEPYSAFLAAYRLSRISCPDALERSTALDPDDPFTIPPGLSGRPTIPPYLHPVLPAGERRARRLALLLDSDEPEIRDWAQAEYLKLGRNERRLVREGVFEVKVAPDGVDEHIPEDRSANEQKEDLEELKERLWRAKERHEEREDDEPSIIFQATEAYDPLQSSSRPSACVRAKTSAGIRFAASQSPQITIVLRRFCDLVENIWFIWQTHHARWI